MRIDPPIHGGENSSTPDAAAPWIISEGLAGLRSQALGLAEAAGISAELRELKPVAPWKWVAAKFWPDPLAAVADAVHAPLPSLAIGCGGMAGSVLAALRRNLCAWFRCRTPAWISAAST